MLIKEGGRTLEEVVKQEISLFGSKEELNDRFADVIANMPRSYELSDCECIEDALGNPQKVILTFERKYI